jgi:putative spermidine/putrescine transport system permease protein
VSFFQRVQGAFYTPAFVFDNYARFLSAFFGGVLAFLGSNWLLARYLGN